MAAQNFGRDNVFFAKNQQQTFGLGVGVCWVSEVSARGPVAFQSAPDIHTDTQTHTHTNSPKILY